MDLVRELLLRIEARHIPPGSAVWLEARREPLAHEDDDRDNVTYNMNLLIDAGFINQTRTKALTASALWV